VSCMTMVVCGSCFDLERATQSGFLSKPEPAIQPITGIQADTRI
jgi:hypothetical protein